MFGGGVNIGGNFLVIVYYGDGIVGINVNFNMGIIVG